jgi:hypothetical protein
MPSEKAIIEIRTRGRTVRSTVELAAGIDTHPGKGNSRVLHEYWVRGKGLAKWKTWTELYRHLLKYIKDPEEAKRTAAQWFHDRYGFWPGDKKNK